MRLGWLIAAFAILAAPSAAQILTYQVPSAAAVSSQQACARACQLNGFSVTATAPVFVMLFDSNAIPMAGTVATCSTRPSGATGATAGNCFAKQYQIAAGTSSVSWNAGYLQFSQGLVMGCSSTAFPSFTLSASCQFQVDTK